MHKPAETDYGVILAISPDDAIDSVVRWEGYEEGDVNESFFRGCLSAEEINDEDYVYGEYFWRSIKNLQSEIEDEKRATDNT